MNCKALLVCALFAGFTIFTARASEPVTYKEIAMLLRNGEQQQYIMDETASRKLLRPLTKDEEADLVSLGANRALMDILRSPAMLATADAAAAYNARVQQQKLALQQEQGDQQAAAQATPAARTQYQQEAQQQADEYTGKSIDLQFTAADGSPVNLASLRGKVVLIDFWATWCGPCMKEVPNVVAAYKKYRDQGFEIIGISLDQSKDAMFKVNQEKEMTWPQYFDGKGWQNEIATRFHIRAIPAMWLVSKKGIVATTAARGNLDADIAKLLAE
jgi:thiol-disulfide isomerase/thioredoxin